MKYTFTLQPQIKQKFTYSKNMQSSFNIMKMSNFSLIGEIKKAMISNPFIQFSSSNADSIDIDALLSSRENIKDDLISQVNTLKSKINKPLAYYIIQSLDNHGFFTEDYSEVTSIFSISEDEFNCTLNTLKNLTPLGTASKNSIDFILFQLYKKKDILAAKIISEYSYEIEHNDINSILSDLSITKEEYDYQLNLIRSCSIFPYIEENNEPIQTIIPDLCVDIQEHTLNVSLINEISLDIVNIDPSNITNDAKVFLNDAKTLVNNLSFRNFNLLLVANDLFKTQEKYFLFDEPSQKCTLADISSRTGLSISTISRITNEKYYIYNNTIYPLTSLLCKGVHNTSTKMIEESIRTLILSENIKSPLSDDEISSELSSQGVTIARRTVAKYRAKLNIPSCKLRYKK